MLPRLYSFLRQLQAHYREEVVPVCQLEPAQALGQVLLLDLGESCAPDAWHCEVSGGRSTLVVLDGMGYAAARVEDAAAKRAKMGSGVQIALIDGDNPARIDDVLITAAENRGEPDRSPRRSANRDDARRRNPAGRQRTPPRGGRRRAGRRGAD